MSRFFSTNNTGGRAAASAYESAVAEWLQSAEGEIVLQREHERIGAQLAQATVLMPSSVIYQSRPWFKRERLSCEQVIQLYTAEPRDGGDWPLPPEPVDLLVLPHEFELCDQPQRLLSWADTVLNDKGWMIITGFKPGGLLALLFGWRMAKSWSRNRVSGSMLRLWLTEAGYKVIQHENWSYAKALEAQRSGIQSWLPQWLRPKHHGYLVAARKIAIPGTPLASRWKGLSNPMTVATGAAASREHSAASVRPQVARSESAMNGKV